MYFHKHIHYFILSVHLASGIRYPGSAQIVHEITGGLAWAGGMNACQFGEIDLDLNGTLDLILFDRHGNRLIPLVYLGPAGSVAYRPDTSFTSAFPDLHDWVITADYDCDGRMDLFTYGLGGIRVFRNTSEEHLAFQQVTGMLTSWYYSGFIGILVTPVDYPAVADIDGDGDLDILTFFGLGSFVEYHQNQSVEKYGTCDSLDFRMADNCWGKFRESEGSNKITLDADCPSSKYEVQSTKYEFLVPRPTSAVLPLTSHVSRLTSHDRHTGSTLLATDLNGDGLTDLLLGDVDYPNLVALYNGGTADTAFMVSYDTLFPPGPQPVNLFDFPVPSRLDADHDGQYDLVVSSFNPQLAVPDNYESSWYYRGSGPVDQPIYEFQNRRFLQDQMIDVGSGSYPAFTDLDGDGLTDLLIGCWGRYDSSFYQAGVLHSVHASRISFYRNTGNPMEPSFTLVTDDLGSLSTLGMTGLYPAFADLNGDGSTDLVIGQEDGTLAYLENHASASLPPDYLPPEWNYHSIDVGENSTPQLVDFDGDGLTDLVIGERNGNLNYYRNAGTAGSPLFVLITDSLGKVNVTNYQLSYTGYSVPHLFRDGSGRLHLLVGSEEGKLWYYADLPSDPEAAYQVSENLYTLVTGSPFPVGSGWRTAPAIVHLTDSVWYDLVTGNYAGGLTYFCRHTPPRVFLGSGYTQPVPPRKFTIYPNPAGDLITIGLSSPHAQPVHLQIVNLFGQIVFHHPVTSGETLSIARLPKGLYLVILQDPAGQTTYLPVKLLIQH